MAVDLRTPYLGLTLGNPVVVSACPLTSEPDVALRLQELGAAALSLPSLFEEQLEQAEPSTVAPSFRMDAGKQDLSYYRALQHYNRGPQAYLRYLAESKQRLKIPVFASLNGTTAGAWVRYAAQIEDAGADALELNMYYVAADAHITGQQVEDHYLELVAAVRKAVKIPLAVKIGPHFTALANVARRLIDAGANGLVLFNRFLQPDIDVDTLSVMPHLTLSTRDELRLPLRWVAILRGQLTASLAATGGIHHAEDVIKALLAGADVAMVASTLYRYGIDHLKMIIDELRFWLEASEYVSLNQLRGNLSQARCADPGAFERANYTKAVSSFMTE